MLLTLSLLAEAGRSEQDFNAGWRFHLGDDVTPGAGVSADELAWQVVRLPHDWAISEGFTQQATGSSTGFLPGGIGWYRKSFKLPESWRGQRVILVFDGVYKLARVWLNGQEVGGRPNGFVSFDLDLTTVAHYGEQTNELLVRVDHSAYIDTRWYCGSGIYRNVRLVSTARTYIPESGVWVQTPEINADRATVTVTTTVVTEEGKARPVQLAVELLDPAGQVVASRNRSFPNGAPAQIVDDFTVPHPQSWDLVTPKLYQARVRLERDGQPLDERSISFGVRTARFDARQGFLLNGQVVKIKGVNLHHDAGLVGVAVPKDVWRDRLVKLRSVGVNAVRTAHNPPSPEFLDLCDELGFLVMDEFFDEWSVPKDKSLVWLGDNKAPPEVNHGYSELFAEWAERDVKATIRRDRNHPSVILWSIGNEIEWTYPYYSNASSLNGDTNYFTQAPDFDPVKIRERMAKVHPGPDELLAIAQRLSGWVRETDPTRPVTSGLVHPSVGFATGYAAALGVVGFNYRANEYDGAHAMYPSACIMGSENWGTCAEWEAVQSRDFVAGMFIWTGYAYLGEAGPWPRKGLEISLFDFAGFQTPRGAMFECLWRSTPKVWVGTTRAEDSEYSQTAEGTWKFTQRAYEPPAMKWLRRWEWDRVAATWNYPAGEDTIVQVYANTEEVELLLNDRPLGRQKMADWPDHIAKWAVPFVAGRLEVVGLNGGQRVATDLLQTSGPLAAIQLKSDRSSLKANDTDVVRVELQLRDAAGIPVVTADREVIFDITGPVRILGVDNGWESSVQPYQVNHVVTWQGRAMLLLQAQDQVGLVTVTARGAEISSPAIELKIE